jgi:hypothetical protein
LQVQCHVSRSCGSDARCLTLLDDAYPSVVVARCVTQGYQNLYYGSGPCGDQPSNVIPYLTDGLENCWYNGGSEFLEPFPNEFTFKQNLEGCMLDCGEFIVNLISEQCSHDSVAGRDMARLLSFVDRDSPISVSRQLLTLALQELSTDDCHDNCPVSYACLNPS